MSVRKPTTSRKAKIAGTEKPTPRKVLKKALRKKFLGKAALVKKMLSYVKNVDVALKR